MPRKKKTTTPASKVNELIASGLYIVKDATKPLRFYINGDHHAYNGAVPCNGEACAIAVALTECVPELMAVEVGSTMTKVVIPGLCLRYKTPPRLRKALQHFDDVFKTYGILDWDLPDGTYVLPVPKGKYRLTANMTKKERSQIRSKNQDYDKRVKNGKKTSGKGKTAFKARPIPTRRISVTYGPNSIPVD